MTQFNIPRCAALLTSLTAGASGLMAQQAKTDLSAQRNGSRPNIVMVISEDLSPRWHCFGDPVARTPNLDALAEEGVRLTNVHTMCGVSGPSRSGLVTGIFQNFTNMPHMRSCQYTKGPYFAVPQPDVKGYPELLRRSGYFTYCDVKFDYQFTTPTAPGAFSLFNEVEKGGYNDINSHLLNPRWREYDMKGRPFYFNYNPQITHESGLFRPDDPTMPKWALASAERQAQMREMYKDRIVPTDPKKVNTKPFFIDTKASRKEIALFYDNIQVMDCQVGDLVKNLKEDGLWDNTIFIVTTDHGDCLPRSKRDIYNSSTLVPMIVHVPDKYRPAWLGANGTANDRLISFEDLPVTFLNIAGVPVPEHLHGINLAQDNPEKREFFYVNRARQAAAQWQSYAVQDNDYEYVRNLSDDPNGFSLPYRNILSTVKDLNAAHDKGTLPEDMKSWYEKRPVEELYDLKNDPNEFHNLAADPAYAQQLARFRKALDNFRDRGNDAMLMPEDSLRKACLDENGKQKVTASPYVTQDEVNQKVYISSLTDGASIGYSFDGKFWELYTKAFTVPADADKVYVKAVRYGWKESKTKAYDLKH